MKDKTQNNSTKKPLSKEDRQLYRLFLIFAVAILGFAALRLINESRLMAFLVVGRWIALGLLILNIAALIYLRCVKKINEEGHLLTACGVSYFTISVFALMVIYQELNNSNVKVQVAFAFISLLAIIYNLFRREFVCVSACSFIEAMFLYFIHTPAYSMTEKVLRGISYVGAFLLPVLLLAFAVAAFVKKGTIRFGSRTIYSAKTSFEPRLLAVLGGILLVAALLTLLVPAMFVAVLIALLVIYVVIGMVCTIKLI